MYDQTITALGLGTVYGALATVAAVTAHELLELHQLRQDVRRRLRPWLAQRRATRPLPSYLSPDRTGPLTDTEHEEIRQELAAALAMLNETSGDSNGYGTLR